MQDLWNVRENLTVSMAQLTRSNNPLYGAVLNAPSSDALLPVGLAGRLFKYDLSVRLQDTDEVLHRLKQRLLDAGFRMKGVDSPPCPELHKHPLTPQQSTGMCTLLSACELEFCNYGHIADQNIHLNVLGAVNTVTDDAPPLDLLSGDGGRRCNNCNGEVELQLKGPGDALFGEKQVPVRARQYQQTGATKAKVCIHQDSLPAYFKIIHAEVNRHTFETVLETKGKCLLWYVLLRVITD